MIIESAEDDFYDSEVMILMREISNRKNPKNTAKAMNCGSISLR